MKIAIKGLHDDRYQRPLSLIADLFFEETEVVLGESASSELEVSFTVEDNGGSIFRVHGVLGELTCSHEKDLGGSDEKESFRRKKQAVSYVYLTLLQEHTGIIQKWGILTGIRPTKLLHSKLQKGEPQEKVHNQLREDYLITDEKIELMQQIVDRQLDVVPDLHDLGHEVSIYIGIPFCPTKCAYCTFPAYAINGKQGKVDSFLGGLHHEIDAIGAWLKEKGIKITTVYYGGGTPTSITAEEMDMLYEQMYASFPDMEKVREVTVEAGRPDTITPQKLEVLKKWNIDRISINPQSYTQETLKAIGRHHTVEETIDKFHLAREMGMNNINMDLIIGLPGEGVEEFAHTLEETEKLMPESLTVHTLSFKRASEMTQNKNRYKVADRHEIGKMMDMATEWTTTHNYVPYYLYRQKNILGNLENVGYALPGQDSIYNIMIMEEKQTIIGLGCGASSKFVHPETGKITRFANPKDPKSYNDGFEHYTDEKIRMLEELFSK
ncbi:coproporphyrinogen III oxidase [Sutcliffiella horikoshii]|uniref:coproporphyrinogen III oxidase n=1 Tax=Sutcliffiella horikoshii TaxID=79883 RepID=UPI00203AD6B7|nr:coproporphyrinogen III oxidase [Sutcliffiella horikoshii]MCM3617004.1 coproporphyrinogen III oxidase [Sutcliffiella horikoshii]